MQYGQEQRQSLAGAMPARQVTLCEDETFHQGRPCLVAMERGAIPPTINLDYPDPECALCHVANQAREAPVRVAVSNSFGFGGSNTCLVLEAV